MNKKIKVLSLFLILGLSACSDTEKVQDSEVSEKQESISLDVQKEEKKEIKAETSISNNFSVEEQEYYNEYINRMISIEKSIDALGNNVAEMIDSIGVEIYENKEAITRLKESKDAFSDVAVLLETNETTEQLEDYHNAMFITALSYSKAMSDIVDALESRNIEMFRSGVQSYRDAKSNLEVAVSMREEATKGMFFLKIEDSQ
ncbi:hypothetical protein MHB42_09810 [Lysinibacillus sp. FSL K6-0232]|uniref:hypothetical protein n=1 Tax=Lysinibacillus sp. FSL K6-0232 TaxID=2921425 RepID=UPI0030F98070